MEIPRLFAATLFLVFTAQNTFGQSSAAEPAATEDTTQTATAAIYITVASKKGTVIGDLKPEDITITENKVPAKVEKVTCGKPEPLLVGILVDVSGSRRMDSHLREHYDALEGFLHTLLTGNDEAYVVAYGDNVYKLSELVADSAGISAAFDKLRKHQPAGSTALYDAIKAAAAANFKGRSGHRALVVLGDWEDNSSHVTSDEAIKAAQRTSTTIYAVVDSDNGIYSKKSHKRAVDTAKNFCGETGGLDYVVEDKNDFAKVLQAIGGAVASACRVEYTTSENADPKRGVKLHVQANSKDNSIRYPSVRFSSSQ